MSGSRPTAPSRRASTSTINGDRKDNRLENLEMLEARAHHREHTRVFTQTPEHRARAAKVGRDTWAAKPLVEMTCISCGKAFSKKVHNRHGIAKYCSKPCRGRDYYETKGRDLYVARKGAR